MAIVIVILLQRNNKALYHLMFIDEIWSQFADGVNILCAERYMFQCFDIMVDNFIALIIIP